MLLLRHSVQWAGFFGVVRKMHLFINIGYFWLACLFYIYDQHHVHSGFEIYFMYKYIKIKWILTTAITQDSGWYRTPTVQPKRWIGVKEQNG